MTKEEKIIEDYAKSIVGYLKEMKFNSKDFHDLQGLIAFAQHRKIGKRVLIDTLHDAIHDLADANKEQYKKDKYKSMHFERANKIIEKARSA